MIRERDRDCDRDNSSAISTHSQTNLFDNVQVLISSLSQKTQRTITSHDFSKMIILQANSLVSFFKSRVLKIFSREFNMTTEISSRRDFITTAKIAISRVLLTIILNINFSRFDIELVNNEIVKCETKNQKYTRFLVKETAAKRIQNLTRLKNQAQWDWINFDLISRRFQNILESLMYHDFKHEKYLKIKISSMYKVKSILKLKEIIRACNLIFKTRHLFYIIDQHKIMYIKTYLHQDIFNSKWAWNKHVKKLRVAS